MPESYDTQRFDRLLADIEGDADAQARLKTMLVIDRGPSLRM